MSKRRKQSETIRQCYFRSTFIMPWHAPCSALQAVPEQGPDRLTDFSFDLSFALSVPHSSSPGCARRSKKCLAWLMLVVGCVLGLGSLLLTIYYWNSFS